MAEALREWLPTVIQAAKPFMSETDIDKGSRGLHEITQALEGIKVGIVCLTPENLDKSWLAYEAGALSKTIDDKTRLCTYLLGGLEFQNVRPPLGMFQHTQSTKDDSRKLTHAINSAISDDPIADGRLNTIFDKMWPELEKSIAGMPSPDQVVEAKRSPDEMIAEILDLSRAAANTRKQSEWIDQYIPALQQFFPLLEQQVRSAQSGGHLSAQTKTFFAVMLKDDDEIKKIEGTRTEQTGSGEFVIYDGDSVVARFSGVERWWKM